MSKLDGNGRWQSKMTLTEHTEQYEARHDSKTSRPTSEEYTMARDYILLPHMLTMIERSIEEIRTSTNILKRLYLIAAQTVMNQIHKDMYSLRRELSKRNIKVINDEQIDLVIYYKIMCRGYEERFGIVRDVVRSEISVRLTNYLKDVAKFMEQYGK
ncbi:hypothetical protein NLX71_00260 [Paenibacillus sp. MZ04-78.2]|uniref:hypothetical protein n=1 Tax=Paenibacillus sp. MZ04-78.2 TaxID=2962034 RepID=UPI0020B89A02|nr:hypothetical protein [Paenibacillus sp. MZ04-78.2]MCP3771754.1 hypothetical protein [Paenibacillus sp. MZ04-78.2]